MKAPLLLVPILFVLAAPPSSGGAAGQTEARPEPVHPAPEAESPAQPPGLTEGPEVLRPGRAPSVRVVVVDSRDLGPEMEAESRVLRGPEMREILRISRHRGSAHQLLLYSPPWRHPVLFQPGAVIHLETAEHKKERLAAARGEEAAEREGAEEENP